MKRSIRVILMASALLAILAVSALPAAAHGFGPAFYCDAGKLVNCTDTVDVAGAEDTFSCSGKAGDVASCTNRRTGEVSPYCPFLGHEPNSNRDAYLCGPTPAQEEGHR